ncbi:MAG: hypothetical protein WBE68_27820 [Candidatus Nitrosopolaris sp.]
MGNQSALVTGVSAMLTIPTTTIPAHADCGSSAIACCPNGMHWNSDLQQCTND